MKVTNSVELYKKISTYNIYGWWNYVGEIEVIAGQPKSCKSLFALSLCVQVSKGESFLDFKTLESGVLYLCLEGGEQLIFKFLLFIYSK